MTQTNGRSEQSKYIEEWAKMMVTIWEERILLSGAIDSGSLLNSVKIRDFPTSNDASGVIEHMFNYYGVYVDRGTGKEIKRGNPADLGFSPIRKAKPWLNKRFFYYTRRLAERLAEINGEEATYIIRDIIEGK